MLQIWSISAIVKRRFEFFGKNPPHSGIGATAHRWFDSRSMIERYSLPKMRSIWTEQRKLEIWLEIETLAERKSDSLDFHEVSVWGLKDALLAAYELGLAAAKKGA